jgi:hypothetical protein
MFFSGAGFINQYLIDHSDFDDGDINVVMNRLNKTLNGVCLAPVKSYKEHEKHEENYCAVLQVLLNHGLIVDECAFLLVQSCEKGYPKLTRMLLECKGHLRRDGTYHGAVTIQNEVNEKRYSTYHGCTPMAIAMLHPGGRERQELTEVPEFTAVKELLIANGADIPTGEQLDGFKLLIESTHNIRWGGILCGSDQDY